MNVDKLPEIAYFENAGRTRSYDTDAPVIAVKRGETGFYPVFTRQTADALNAAAGITPAQLEAMLAGSMFGFDAPGANPDLYDERGRHRNARSRLH